MATTGKRIKLDSQGLECSAQGLGYMDMSASYGAPKPEPDMNGPIHHAVDSGITYLPTSDEILHGKALKGGMREKVELATKFGVTFADGSDIRGDPAYVRPACVANLKRFFVDYQYHHPIETRIPIEVRMGELKKLVEEGKIKYVGLSEASASTIRRAHAVLPITAVQLEWSFWSRDEEEEIVSTCRELGIGILAYSSPGRGLFSSGPKLLVTRSEDDSRQLSALTTLVSSLSYQVAQVVKLMESLPAQVLAKAESSVEVVNATVSSQINELSNAKHMLASNMDYLMQRVDYGIEREGIHHIDIRGRMETMQKEIAECYDILNGFKLRAQGR